MWQKRPLDRRWLDTDSIVVSDRGLVDIVLKVFLQYTRGRNKFISPHFPTLSHTPPWYMLLNARYIASVGYDQCYRYCSLAIDQATSVSIGDTFHCLGRYILFLLYIIIYHVCERGGGGNKHDKLDFKNKHMKAIIRRATHIKRFMKS